MANNEARPKIGVGILVFRDGRILLGRRLNAHGADEYAGPGGNLEFGETLEAAVRRELAEECGKHVVVENLRVICLSDLLAYMPNHHYIDVGFAADWVSGEPEVCEPDKVESWGWYDPKDLPSRLFGCVDAYIESHQAGAVGHYTFLAPEIL